MSSVTVFIYSYHSTKDIIRNICLGAKRYSKGYIENATLTLSNGYANVIDKGKYNVDGVLFKFIDDDFKRLELYLDQTVYKGNMRLVQLDVNLYSKKSKEVAYMFVANEEKPLLLDKEQFDKLLLMYEENGFDTFNLELALAKVIKSNFPHMKKYMYVKRRDKK